MKAKKVLPVLAVCLFVFYTAKAQSTISYEYGRKYSKLENTGIYLYDAKYFKDLVTYTNFYSFNYQIGLFSDFLFETGISSQFSTYDLAIRLDDIEPPTYSGFHQGKVTSGGIPAKMYYRLELNKTFSIDPSLGFTILFNKYGNNLYGSSYSETSYSIGSTIYKMVSIPDEIIQEKISIVPNIGARLNFKIVDKLILFLKPDIYFGVKTMYQVDYTITFTKNEEVEQYEGSLINKGTSFNISAGLSYTLKKNVQSN